MKPSDGVRCIQLTNQQITISLYIHLGSSEAGNWIQIDLLTEKQVTGIVTQGRGDGHDQWITLYKIFYGDDEHSLVPISSEDGNDMVNSVLIVYATIHLFLNVNQELSKDTFLSLLFQLCFYTT